MRHGPARRGPVSAFSRNGPGRAWETNLDILGVKVYVNRLKPTYVVHIAADPQSMRTPLPKNPIFSANLDPVAGAKPRHAMHFFQIGSCNRMVNMRGLRWPKGDNKTFCGKKSAPCMGWVGAGIFLACFWPVLGLFWGPVFRTFQAIGTRQLNSLGSPNPLSRANDVV